MMRIRNRLQARQFDRAAKGMVSNVLDAVGRATTMEIQRRLVLATPKDTGRAAGNWNADIDKQDRTWDDERREPEALAEAREVAGRVSLSRGQRVWFVNGVPYIGPLNNGHSRQAPAGFVQKVAIDVQGFVRSEIARQRLSRRFDV